MIDTLELQLNEIKIKTVKDYKIIDNKETLIIEIYNYDDTKTIVKFKDVKGFFFQDFEGINDIELRDSSQNLDFISYYKNGFARFSEVNILTAEELHTSIPNFAINLINSSIYVDANIIEINGKDYQVNYYN